MLAAENGGVTLAVALGVGVPATVALVGYFLTYRNNLRIDRHKAELERTKAQREARLERVNRQVGELYGPLLALQAASNIAWQGFRSRYRPGPGSFWKTEPPPTEEEMRAWRLWIRQIFLPLLLRMEEIIVTKADLIDQEELPIGFVLLCAHAAGYRVVAERWAANDFDEHVSLVKFPGELLYEHVSSEFERLKREQQGLIGVLQAPAE